MRSSAVNPFWRGRMASVHVTSRLWNMVNRRLFAGTSRLLHSMASVLTVGTNLFSRDFWRALIRPYNSITFERGIREAQMGKGTDV